MRLGADPTPAYRPHLRLVVDNGHKPKDRRIYVTGEEIRRTTQPRRRWNPWKLLGNVAMMVAVALSMSVLVWAGVAWLTGW